MMKKAFTAILWILLVATAASTAQAQSSKEAIYDKIESSYAWINAAFLRKCTTLNFTEEQWDYALKNEFAGLEVINNAGNNIAAYFELVANSRINDACRYGKGNTGQPTVAWNADGSLTTVNMFVGEEPGDWAANMMKGLEKGGKK